MKKVSFSLILLLFLFITGCKKEDGTPVETDKIKTSLSTTKATYESATSGSWIEITSTEYNSLATTLTNISRVGVSEADFTNVAVNVASSSGIYTLAQNDGVTMPTGSYLFAFKISINTGTNTGAKVKVSNSAVSNGYSDLGSLLPNHGVGEHYFVLKGNAVATTNVGYLAYTISSGVKINFKDIVGKGSYYYVTSDANTLTNSTIGGAVFLAQGLSTTVKQW